MVKALSGQLLDRKQRADAGSGRHQETLFPAPDNRVAVLQQQTTLYKLLQFAVYNHQFNDFPSLIHSDVFR